MQIFVKLQTRTGLHVGVKPSDTIDSVKRKIEDATGVDRYFTAPFFDDDELEDWRTLSYYDIQRNYHLWTVARTRTMEYVVGMSGRVVSIEEVYDDTLNTVKEKIGAVIGVRPDRLTFVGERTFIIQAFKNSFGLERHAIMRLGDGQAG